MMGATRATYHEAYLEKMAQLKEINEAAHKYLVDIGEQHWSKHAFKTYAKCDVLMNNLSESFNAIILLAREKPIVTMLEWIQTYCMTRFATMNETTHKVEGKIMPIAEAKEEARQGRSTQWELLVGIPCRHAIAAINYKGEHAEDHVDKYYHRDTYKLCYSHSITTIDGRKKWSKTNDPDLLPPNYKRAADAISLDITRGLAKIPPFIQIQQRLVLKVREHPVKNNKVMFKLDQMEHKCKLKRTPKSLMVPLHKKSNLVSKKTGPTSASTSTDNPGIAKKVSCATTKKKKETLKKPHLSEQSAQCSNTVSGEDMDTP
ncbi:hypothetical protein D0Y65_025596 [Glycine soja]|uniref:Uncharacterized protein n=1 Tax=Glycine soja TaxID=3848 RepID=A0A445IG23_GLYSO|nr:hypothetical protein D0Y65_025596 [Glycine soja]